MNSIDYEKVFADHINLGICLGSGSPRASDYSHIKAMHRSGSHNWMEHGDIFGPYLFSFYAEYTVYCRKWKWNMILKLGGINNLCYAVDTTLIAENGNDASSSNEI